MVKFNVDGGQNVEVSKKLPSEKTLNAQLEIMQLYTDTHRAFTGREAREVECLKVLYPRLFRRIQPGDLFAGRLDFLPIGFGCVTSLGGVGHYCVFNKLRQFQDGLENDNDKAQVDVLYDYWLDHDLKTKYCKDVLTENTIGRFIDCEYSLIATARLSGMMLDYRKLLDLGIDGLRMQMTSQLKGEPDNAFLKASLSCLDLFVDCALHLADMARENGRHKIAAGLIKISQNKPETFHEAIQLFWLYALLAGVINYGRLDDLLGPFLAKDIAAGRMTEADAYDYIKCLWTMIENRRTTVNGRVIVGGKGRKYPKEANLFAHIAMQVAKDLRFVEPQFTLRVCNDTPESLWDAAMDALGAGATYPTIYNDEINVPAVEFAMRVDAETSEKYLPFGCTEFVLEGQSTGTPNVCMNLLKLFTGFLNGGIDPMDGKQISGPIKVRPLSEYTDFETLYGDFKKLLDYYMDLSIHAQMYSYEVMNKDVSFLFTSILMDDCIQRGKALLDGGVRYLGGTNEIYGLINTSDALWAIKDVVYSRGLYTLEALHQAAMANFEGHEALRQVLWQCDKYGNDLDTADGMAVDLYMHVAAGVRQRGIDAGMQYFLVVISNNQLNTEWGRTTHASLDGRFSGMYMNPANNPQGGANTCGPTAMLNSLAKIDARYHGGSVQNIKFTPAFFSENRAFIKALFKVYFKKGGPHIMVTVVDRGTLEDAMEHPEKYPDLIVRVSGFSAIFVDLERDIQEELISRVNYG